MVKFFVTKENEICRFLKGIGVDSSLGFNISLMSSHENFYNVLFLENFFSFM